MNTPQIDHVSAGYVFAYDATTGDVLWTHEKVVEVIRGSDDYPTRITEAERAQIRAEASRVFRGKEVNALIAPEGFARREGVRIRVDPDTKTLSEVADERRSLADRFAHFIGSPR